MYASQNKNWILGSGAGAGAFYNTTTFADTPANYSPNLPVGGPIGFSDWCGPMGDTLKLAVSQSQAGKDRYDAYRKIGVYLCPSNSGVATAAYSGNSGFPDLDAGPGPQLGYATVWTFLLTSAFPTPGITSHTRISSGAGWWSQPKGYVPKMNKVGKSSAKVYMADAGKYFRISGFADYNIRSKPTPAALGADSGAFTDFGPFTTATAAYDRTVANGGGGVDGRIFSFRHGARKPQLKTGAYRLNALFFDGHAENLGEKEALNPALWVPTGTTFPDATKVWPDVNALWPITSGMPMP
jgi:prepilin-type processing-associated H-X9-DG protein